MIERNQEMPVFVDGVGWWEPGEDGTGRWLVTGYDQARAVLRDGRLSRELVNPDPPGPALRMSITEMDPPRHTRVRTLIGGAFSARHVELLCPEIDGVATELLDELIAANDGADLLADFCAPLTYRAQCMVLGVPEHRREAIRTCAVERLATSGTDPDATAVAEARLHAEVCTMLDDERRPPTGLFAGLIAAHRDGVITEPELTGLAASLFFDGHALAAAQIAHAVSGVLGRPGLLARLAGDAALLDGVVEESLRHNPSVNLSMARIAKSDFTLGDMRVRAGDRVTVAIPAANRDGAAFAGADVFDPHRSPSRHLSFGFGTHHCIGAYLARVEMRAALSALARRVPGLRLAEPLELLVSPMIRTLTALPVRWSGPVRSETGPKARNHP
jgi:cytochrome P450